MAGVEPDTQKYCVNNDRRRERVGSPLRVQPYSFRYRLALVLVLVLALVLVLVLALVLDSNMPCLTVEQDPLA